MLPSGGLLVYCILTVKRLCLKRKTKSIECDLDRLVMTDGSAELQTTYFFICPIFCAPKVLCFSFINHQAFGNIPLCQLNGTETHHQQYFCFLCALLI